MSPSLPTRLVWLLAWCAGSLGPGLRQRLAVLIAEFETRRRSRRARIVATNLRLAGLERPGMVRSVLVHTALTALESFAIWTRPRERNLAAIDSVQGEALFDAARAAGGLLLVAPHHGNWELLLQWAATRGPLTLLYTRVDSPALEGFLRLARERHGVRAVAASAHGMKPLLQSLQRGEIVGITPDQVPESGGEWAEFFGVPALTMTLIQRLAARTGATPLLACAERAPGRWRFTIRIEPLPEALRNATAAEGAQILNLAVEALVRRDPAQYQWTYKRYKGQRPGEALINPYWPECYPP